MGKAKPAEDLTAEDFQAHPIWEFTDCDEEGETLVEPVEPLPVATLGSRLIGTQLRLANGSTVQGALGNIDERDARATEQFALLKVFHDGRSFMLARYHDIFFDAASNGPEALARFLQLPIDEVFPISFDLRALVLGAPAALVGAIHKEPRERLTRSELTQLALR